MGLRVTTNNHRREILDAWSVPAEVRKDFDYLDWDKMDKGEDSASFVKYKGEWYDLGDVLRTDPASELAKLGWHGFNSDSYFSGMAVKYIEDDDNYGDPSVVIAYVYWQD